MADVDTEELRALTARIDNLDKICIESLELNVNAGYDGFGRPKAQPVAIDVTAFLNQTVTSAAAGDGLDESTLHYGELSKALVAGLESRKEEWQAPHSLVESLMATVVGFAKDRSALAHVDIEVRFKNASVASTLGSVFQLHSNFLSNVSCLVFSIQKLVLPALIGVNKHERQMRQQISISIAIDRLSGLVANECYQAEQIIVKTVEETSFETLEALCEKVAANIVKYFILARRLTTPTLADKVEPAGVKVRIGKPFAVALAKSATVEIYRSAQQEDAFGRRMLAELGTKRPQIPFPLPGRLDEFLRAWKQD